MVGFPFAAPFSPHGLFERVLLERLPERLPECTIADICARLEGANVRNGAPGGTAGWDVGRCTGWDGRMGRRTVRRVGRPDGASDGAPGGTAGWDGLAVWPGGAACGCSQEGAPAGRPLCHTGACWLRREVGMHMYEIGVFRP